MDTMDTIDTMDTMEKNGAAEGSVGNSVGNDAAEGSVGSGIGNGAAGNVPAVSKGKRIGYFFLSLSLALLCVVMQVLALFVILIPALVFRMVSGGMTLSETQAFDSIYMDLVKQCTGPGICLYHITGILLFGLWYRFSFKKPRPTIKGAFRNTTGKAALLAVLCGVGLCFFANATVILESYLIPSIVETYTKMAEQAGFGIDVFTIIATVILAPIGEEFLCRGLILKYARKSFGDANFWAANILQAFLFACIHANWVQGIYAFFIGLVLGWMVERYHTLLPGILLHFVVNFSSSTWVSWLLGAIFGEEMPSALIGAVWLVLASVLILGLLYWERPKKAETAI